MAAVRSGTGTRPFIIFATFSARSTVAAGMLVGIGFGKAVGPDAVGALLLTAGGAGTFAETGLEFPVMVTTFVGGSGAGFTGGTAAGGSDATFTAGTPARGAGFIGGGAVLTASVFGAGGTLLTVRVGIVVGFTATSGRSMITELPCGSGLAVKKPMRLVGFGERRPASNGPG